MKSMKELIEGFSEQVLEAIEIAQKIQVKPSEHEIKNVVVSGLGGSGIGGNMAGEMYASELKIPYVVNKDYFIPNFVDKHTLFIACSYSGNTEETLNAYELAKSKGAKIFCISSGGKLIESAKSDSFDYITVPGGQPPRACLGYSLVQLLFVLNKLELVGSSVVSQLKAACELLEKESENIKSEASAIAKKLIGKMPIIYSTTPIDSVGIRFKQQINENSKMLCWEHVIPEMNHNELVGWRQKNENFTPIFLRTKDDYTRNQQRIELNKQIVSKYAGNIVEIWSKGTNLTEHFLYLIHLTDWVSLYIAEIDQRDPVEVKVIDFLKGSLAKND